MRMIEAKHLEAALPRAANRIDVILRVDQKTRRLLCDVPRGDRFSHCGAGADEHPAALNWLRGESVNDDLRKRRARDRHSASTAIAIPIPPPMHNDATP